MATSKRCGVIVVIILTTGLLMGLFWQITFVDASTAVEEPEPPLIGEPCGSGELLPDWVICLHGIVGVEQPGGQVQPQDGITVTVAYDDEIVTGTTFVHPGKIIPTFGIDISPLEPAFLQPVTVTVVVDSVTITRQVVIFPDFNTQNQQVDIVVPIGALAPQISGSVIDFASGGPVAGAGVAVAHVNQTVYLTTAVPISGEQPIFGVEPTSFPGLQAGDTLTFTTTYNGDTDQQTIIYNDAEPVIVNLVTGWKCDGFDPLPRTGPGSGLPRTGPGSGLPDVACFWGYVRQDGQPLAGVDVHITVSDTVYSGQTGAFAGDGLARYGIGLWGAGDLDGEIVTVTAVYNGKTVTETNSINLDAQLSQRTDLILAQPEGLANFISGNFVFDVFWHDGYLWVGTTGGIFRWDTSDGTFKQFTTFDGLPDNYVHAIAANPNDDTLWFTGHGVGHYTPNGNPQWAVWTQEGNWTDANSYDLVVANDNSVWFAAPSLSSEVAHYIPGHGWEYISSTQLGDNVVHSVAIDDNDNLWFGTGGNGIIQYTPGEPPEIHTYTTTHGLSDNTVKKIAIDANNHIWLATANGASHYDPVQDVWTPIYASPEGLVSNSLRSVAVDPDDGSIWFVAPNSASHYFPVTQTWERLTESNGLIINEIFDMAVQSGGDAVWFGDYGDGVTQYDPSNSPEWTTFTTEGVPAHRIGDIAVGLDGALWFASLNRGVSRHTPGGNPEWETFNDAQTVWFTVNDIAVGLDGTIWFANSNRLAYYIPSSDTWGHLHHGNSDMPNVVPKVVEVAQDGSLWLTSSELNGYMQFIPISTPTGITGTWIIDTDNNGMPLANTIDITFDEANEVVWFGTGSGLARFRPATDQWYLFTTSNTGNGLLSNRVNATVVDIDGTVWFGTELGLSHYYPISDTWDIPLTTDNSDLIDDGVEVLIFNMDNSIWLGTSIGVSHYTPGGNPEWESITQENGLADNHVWSMALDQLHKLWFGTENGISWWVDPGQQSDLSLQLEAAEGVFPGEVLTATAVLENVGQRDALHTVVTATLPASVTFQSASPSPVNTNPLVWQLGTLPDEDPPVSIVITGMVEATAVPYATLNMHLETATTSPEAYFTNNTAEATTVVRDPFHADVRTTLTGPPQMQPDSEVEFMIFADNFGGVTAETTTLSLQLPPELSFVSASMPPVSTAPVTWDLGAVDAEAAPIHLTVTTAVDSDVGQTTLTATAMVTSSTADSNPVNNSSSVAIPTTLDSALTLILAAPSRLAERYGASPAMDRIYALAQHPQVQGVVVDVMADTAVAAAYTAWDADPGSWQKANVVAEKIKALIDSYTIAYPNLEYLQLVGGDDIIPFYRIDDQNSTMWHEQRYASFVPPGTTIRAALNKDRLLTDDYYADRTPTTPSSPFWYDSHKLFLPDFAVGRLVETPDEMGTAVDSFLANNGQINLDTNLVGYLSDLTYDWGLEQCDLLEQDGQLATCTSDQALYAQLAVEQQFSGLWSAPHANHFNTGLLTSSQLQNSSTDYSQSLMSTIGCHAGLNIAAGSSQNSNYPHLDMAQAFLGQGGTFIGSTGYTFASYISVGYSEALLQRFTAELLADNNRAVGAALLDAKHGYYAEHSGWFDYNDEKVSVALTLYGFPMLQVTSPPSSRNHVEKSSLAQIVTSPAFQSTGVVTYTYAGLTVTEHDLGIAGIYYDHQGQSLAQELLPLQPLLPESVPTDIMGQTVRGMVLRQASYTSIDSFDPVINQSFAMGAEVQSPAEPPITFTGWDRQRPYHLGIFDGLNNATTSLNLILGQYNADLQTELLFDGLQFELLYSDANDVTPPTFIAQTANGTLLTVTAADDIAVERVIAVCDNGSGVWSSIYLAANGADWQGNCPGDTVRAYAQVVDAAGNVTITPWVVNFTAPPEIDFTVLINSSFEDVTLIWEPITEDDNGSPITVDHYEIWRSAQPYFLPAGSSPNPHAIVSSPESFYIDEDALDTPGIQYYYQVRAIGAASQLLVDSQQVGLIAMTLVPGE